MTSFRAFVCLLLSFFGLLTLVSASPVPLIGQLVDARQKPIPYASLGIFNTAVGTVANAQGQFTLYITDAVKLTDTVRISLIGYRSLVFTVADLKEKLTANPRLAMTEEPRELGEIRINAKNSQVKTIGKTGYRTNMATNFAISGLPRQNLGAEIGRRFNVSKGENRLEKFQFYVLTNFDSVAFRINVYRAKDLKNLLPKNVYVTLNKRTKQWVEVDLMPCQLVVSDDVIVAVEWIDSAGKGTGLQMPLQMPAAATHYYRYGSQDRWKKFRGMTTAMNLTFIRAK